MIKKFIKWVRGENHDPKPSNCPTIIPREILSIDLRFDKDVN